MRRWTRLLGDRPVSLVAQPEIHEPAEVEGADTHREAEFVSLHAPVARPAMVVGHQPGDGALDHGAPPAVVVDELRGLPGPASLHELGVVRADVQAAAILGGGAALPQRAGPAEDPKVAEPLAEMGTLRPAGQVAVRGA